MRSASKVLDFFDSSLLRPLAQERLACAQHHEVDFRLSDRFLFFMVTKTFLDARFLVAPELRDRRLEFLDLATWTATAGSDGLRATRIVSLCCDLASSSSSMPVRNFGIGVKGLDEVLLVNRPFFV